MDIKHLSANGWMGPFATGRALLVIFAVFSGILVWSCRDQVAHRDGKETETDLRLKTALLKGYYEQVTDDIGIVAYKNDLYYFSMAPEGFSSDKFMLHLIRHDLSFSNRDFYNKDAIVDSTLTHLFRNVQVLNRTIQPEDFQAFRTGQFRKTDEGNENLWTIQAKFAEIKKKRRTYKNEWTNEIGVNLLSEYFENALAKGVFFQIRNGFFILLYDDILYFITADEANLTDRVMLHFIKDDHTFENVSFPIEQMEYQQYLEPPYNRLRIARIDLPMDKRNFSKIRVGQYNSHGNLWVQIINIEEVYTNELLRYEHQFSNNTNDR